MGVWLWQETPKYFTPAAYAAAAMASGVSLPSQRVEWVWTEQAKGVRLIASAPA